MKPDTQLLCYLLQNMRTENEEPSTCLTFQLLDAHDKLLVYSPNVNYFPSFFIKLKIKQLKEKLQISKILNEKILEIMYSSTILSGKISSQGFLLRHRCST